MFYKAFTRSYYARLLFLQHCQDKPIILIYTQFTQSTIYYISHKGKYNNNTNTALQWWKLELSIEWITPALRIAHILNSPHQQYQQFQIGWSFPSQHFLQFVSLFGWATVVISPHYKALLMAQTGRHVTQWCCKNVQYGRVSELHQLYMKILWNMFYRVCIIPLVCRLNQTNKHREPIFALLHVLRIHYKQQNLNLCLLALYPAQSVTNTG